MRTQPMPVHPCRNQFLNSRAPKATLTDFLDWLWDPNTVPLLGSMASFSDLTETKVLDHVLGKTSFTMPATVALALTTVVPTDASTGVSITEATGATGYARQTIAGAGWNAAAAGSSTNNGAITFAAITAGTATVIGWMLADSATTNAGNALVWGTTTSVVISSTQTPPTIASGILQVTLD